VIMGGFWHGWRPAHGLVVQAFSERPNQFGRSAAL
jgi:hypothetical protein